MRTVKIVTPPCEPGGITTGRGTKVYDAETGAEIQMVERVEIGPIACDEVLRADVRLLVHQIEVEACPRWQIRHPHTGETVTLSKIVLDDGTEVDLTADLGAAEYRVATLEDGRVFKGARR